MRTGTTAIVARNETWTGRAETEPYEAVWAGEAIVFVRALKPATGNPGVARVEISPDGIHWVAEGSTLTLPRALDEVGFVRIAHFGAWLRLVADLPEGAALTVLVTIQLKG
jgi:hypothetical protein